MFWSAAVAVIGSLALAAALFVVVAASSGRLTVKDGKIERVVNEANRRLNAEGEGPHFLERLDHPSV